ncbi:alpha/beta fold hydrolase [Demequina sp. NBRC 110054]|uniref:alpha/beta fold hydrolase n=1 Tax=Demequina sp. NBRC 110054 TaxID=1570343 RepID=UPI000A06E3A7|nr:alpha/beta hydrolase [Demequina sp. NBRC 110054]
MTKREIDVPVSGGELHVAVWEPSVPARADVIAVHGITASHHAWEWLAKAAPDLRLVAPDLRGRGRSQGLQTDGGLASHADDLAEIAAALGLRSPVILGHSMGAFVAVTAASRHPDLTSSLVMVDGGVPLGLPPGISAAQAMEMVLGPTAARLRMRFPDTQAYLDFWRAHPAFVGEWSPSLEAYFAYDLVPDGDGLRPATAYETAATDTADLLTGSALHEAWDALAVPTRLLTVPLGLTAQPPGLYPADVLEPLLVDTPVMHERVDGFNHYTITMSPSGAEIVAGVLDDVLLVDASRDGGV